MILMSVVDTIQVSSRFGGVNSKGDYEFELALFVKNFIAFSFKFFDIDETIDIPANSPFNLRDIIALLIYGYLNGITSTVVIASNSEFHELYKLVSNNLIISDRTLRDYREKYCNLFEKILSLTLIFAYYIGFTDFEHIAFRWNNSKSF